jgi:hypothetical protein
MLDNVFKELRNNPRLRWGMWLVVGIFWLYAVILLGETLQDRQQQYGAAAQSVSRLQAQLAQPEWMSRVESVKTMAVQLEGRLWQAPTSGLAQAAFQDWLNAALAKAGAVSPVITVTVIDEIDTERITSAQNLDTTTPPDLWKITAKLGFGFEASTLLDFLNQIESYDREIVVSSITVRKEPSAHIEMELNAYFQKQAETTKQGNRATPDLPSAPL